MPSSPYTSPFQAEKKSLSPEKEPKLLVHNPNQKKQKLTPGMQEQVNTISKLIAEQNKEEKGIQSLTTDKETCDQSLRDVLGHKNNFNQEEEEDSTQKEGPNEKQKQPQDANKQ